jgi:hypothetical protein
MSAAASDPPQSLTAAARGFVQLGAWLAGLAGEQAVDVARSIDQDSLDATRAVARAATLPLLGWVGFLSEVLDSASVILQPPQTMRQVTSSDFVGHDDWTGGSQLQVSALTNGFLETLPDNVSVSVEPAMVPQDRPFSVRLRATNIPHECVGVYEGDVGPEGVPPGSRITVWLVIP